jgi:hypothetical protein
LQHVVCSFKALVMSMGHSDKGVPVRMNDISTLFANWLDAVLRWLQLSFNFLCGSPNHWLPPCPL